MVTGFNSFFIASDMVAALREARRVARPAASVTMTVFGRPDRCQSTAVFASLKPFMPEKVGEQKDEAKDPPAPLHEEGALDELAVKAGLTPKEAGYLEIVEEYPDLETMLRGYMAAAPFVRAARVAGDEVVRSALSDALAALEAPDGRFRLVDEVRYLIASA